MLERRTVWLILSAAGRFLLSLLLVGLATSCLIRLAPGFGVDERELDTRLSNQSIQELREAGGNQNIFSAYLRYLQNSLRGDLGHSMSLNRPVSELIQQRYPTSVRILTLGLASAWVCAFLLAAAGVVFQVPATAFVGTASGALILCLPSALLAYVCYLVRAPAFLAVGLVVFARLYRMVDNLFRNAQRNPHILAARAQGMGEFRIFAKHVLATATSELIALGGASVSMAVSATIAAEALCDQPGLGQLAWKAALSRDLPLLLALTLIVAAVTLFCNRGASALVRIARPAA